MGITKRNTDIMESNIGTMKQYKMRIQGLILAVMIWLGACVAVTGGNANKEGDMPRVALPLQAVDADSLQLLDFFWYKYRGKGARYLGIEEQGESKSEWKWAVKGHATARRKAEANKLTITGTDGGIRQALHLFRENYSMALLTADAHYFDNAERILYNQILQYWQMVESGQQIADDTSLQTKREVAGLLYSAGTMAYAMSGEHIFVNLLTKGLTHLKNSHVEAYIQSVNSSPWYYETTLQFQQDNTLMPVMDSKPVDEYTRVFFHDTTLQDNALRAPDSIRATLHIRIPSWVRGDNILPGYKATGARGRIQIFVNGQIARPIIQNGYAVLSGVWHPRDLIAVKIPTPILRLWPQAEGGQAPDGGGQSSAEGRPALVALQRGPMVYCVEAKSDEPVGFHPKDAVSHRFSKQDSCIVLSVPVEDANGRDTLRALPYYKYIDLGGKTAGGGVIFMNAR